MSFPGWWEGSDLWDNEFTEVTFCSGFAGVWGELIFLKGVLGGDDGGSTKVSVWSDAASLVQMSIRLGAPSSLAGWLLDGASAAEPDGSQSGQVEGALNGKIEITESRSDKGSRDSQRSESSLSCEIGSVKVTGRYGRWGEPISVGGTNR